jgi:hypothetical protein
VPQQVAAAVPSSAKCSLSLGVRIPAEGAAAARVPARRCAVVRRSHRMNASGTSSHQGLAAADPSRNGGKPMQQRVQLGCGGWLISLKLNLTRHFTGRGDRI